jgi:hypothetical protein
VLVADREISLERTVRGPGGDVSGVPTVQAAAETLRERLLATFEMFDLGVDMMTANLRRRHPHASPEEIARLLDDWLLERPGAEAGDGPGVPVSLERFR